jgi:hypothetical protein
LFKNSIFPVKFSVLEYLSLCMPLSLSFIFCLYWSTLSLPLTHFSLSLSLSVCISLFV